MKISRIIAGISVAAVALVLTVAPAATVAGPQPQVIALLQQLMSIQQQTNVRLQPRVDQLMAARANSPFDIDSIQTLQARTDQHMLTASATKPGQTQGEISQEQVSPTKPKEFPPPGPELTQEERERILQGILDLNIKTMERYKKKEGERFRTNPCSKVDSTAPTKQR